MWSATGARTFAAAQPACGDIPGLQAAITSSSPGDTVSLAAGCTYTLTTVDNVDGSAYLRPGRAAFPPTSVG